MAGPWKAFVLDYVSDGGGSSTVLEFRDERHKLLIVHPNDEGAAESNRAMASAIASALNKHQITAG